MKKLVLLLWVFTGCGTAIRPQFEGPLKPPEGKAPVFISYEFQFKNDKHELFIFDQNDRRYNLKIEGKNKVETVVYLPAGRSYFINSILHTHNMHNTEYLLGKLARPFYPKQGEVTYVGFFKMVPLESDGKFKLEEYSNEEIKKSKERYLKTFLIQGRVD